MKKSITSARHGQSLVEFALLLPIILLIAVVIFDLGRAVYYYSAIYNAAREGTRYGVVKPTDYAGMENATQTYAYGLNLTTSDIVAQAGTPQTVGGFTFPTVQVSITYSFTPATPLVSNLLPGGKITLRSRAVMRSEVAP
jgi:Flp pilus assembly protein TadG